MRSTLPAIALILAVCIPVLGQDEPEPGTALKTRSTSVLVDVVVRDKHGRPIKGLKPSDFRILEDGVPQKVTFFQSFEDRFQMTSSAESNGSAVDAPDAPKPEGVPSSPLPRRANPLEGSFTALVFDRLSGTSLKYARDAALEYVSEVASSDSMIGVFLIDLSLRTIQFYTADRDLLESGIKRATGIATSHFYSDSKEIRQDVHIQEELREVEDYMAKIYGPRAALPVVAGSKMLAMHIRMLETFHQLQRDQQGHSTTNALLALVKSLGMLPGRKSILYLSEGIAIPPAVVQRFHAIIDAANRANVSIYPIDAAGLRVESTADETRREIMSLGQRRLDELQWDAEPTSGPMMRYLEKNEDLVRLDPHTGLNELAEDTGGRLIRDTNDLLGGLRQIDQDIHSYYLLAYSPSNQELDGRFRSIEVKVLVPDADIQYRKGYYAVSHTPDEPVLDYEAPALAALTDGHKVNSIPFRASVLSFPKAEDRGFVTVLAEVDPGTISYQSVRDDGSPSFSDFTILTLVRDEDHKVVRKVSQHYRLARSAMKDGDGILFYREMHLPPGTYTFETAGFDAVAAKAGISRVHVDLNGVDDSLPQLSSLMIINAAEQIDDDDRGAETPFHYRNLIFYPNLSGHLSKTRSNELTLFFTVYPSRIAANDAIIEILQNDKELGRSEIKLPAPGETGRIQYASSIPVSDFPPGVYTLRVSLPAGNKVISRTKTFFLTP